VEVFILSPRSLAPLASVRHVAGRSERSRSSHAALELALHREKGKLHGGRMASIARLIARPEENHRPGKWRKRSHSIWEDGRKMKTP